MGDEIKEFRHAGLKIVVFLPQLMGDARNESQTIHNVIIRQLRDWKRLRMTSDYCRMLMASINARRKLRYCEPMIINSCSNVWIRKLELKSNKRSLGEKSLSALACTDQIKVVLSLTLIVLSRHGSDVI